MPIKKQQYKSDIRSYTKPVVVTSTQQWLHLSNIIRANLQGQWKLTELSSI